MKPRFITWKGTLYAICAAADGSFRGIWRLNMHGFVVPGAAWEWDKLTVPEEATLRKEADLGPH